MRPVPEMTSGTINSTRSAAAVSNLDNDIGEDSENSGTETILDDEINADEDMVTLQMLEDHPSFLSDKQQGNIQYTASFQYWMLTDHGFYFFYLQENNGQLGIIPPAVMPCHFLKNFFRNFVNLLTHRPTSAVSTHGSKRIFSTLFI